MAPTTLPQEFALFAGFDQWIIWKAIPKPDGKADKIPINGDGFPINAQDPTAWMNYTTAAALANSIGERVGFVFTAADPFYFVDVDHAWGDDGWNGAARWVTEALPGAVIELSQSGTGFHLFGRYTSVPEHGTRRNDLGLELYTEGRFCAMTFNQMVGAPATDHTANLAQFAAHFPPKAASEGIEWSSAPDPAWSGPVDDDELLRAMLNARGSARQVFGQSLTFAQLWAGDVDESGLSEADLALCSHLAFWTGKDCERIERLFNASGLGTRDKWVERSDYRERTIKLAVEGCQNVYTAPIKFVDPLMPVTIEQITPAVRPGLAMLPIDRQQNYFAGCVWINDSKRIFVPRGLLMDREQFDVAFGGYLFDMEVGSNDTSKSAFECFTKSRAIAFPKADIAAFRPADTPGQLYPAEDGGGLTRVNTYAPALPRLTPGDVSPFLDFMARIMPGELNRTIALTYMCALVQNPGVKFQWAIFVQGVQGTGKTFLTRVISNAIGRDDYVTAANVDDVGNKFNANYLRKLFVILEEVNAHENPGLMESLKEKITNPRIEYQPKGRDQFMGDNFANFMLTSNHKRGLTLTADERRYAPIYLAQQCVTDLALTGLTEDYFTALWHWYDTGGAGAVNHWLHTTPPHPSYNPAGSCTRAPKTENTDEAIAISTSEAALIIGDSIGSAQYGFCGPWISSAALAALFDRRHGFDRRKVAGAVQELGYVVHPGVTDGRVAAVQGEGRPRLFVKPGSPAAGLVGTAVRDAYLKAQNHPEAPAVGARVGA